MSFDYTLELPNDLQEIDAAVSAVIDRGQQVGFDYDRLRLNLRVGLTEALANAMLYGNCRDPRKTVRLTAELTPQRIIVQVTDQGSGFDPSKVSDPTLPVNRLRSGGRGIFLIRKLMDRVEFNDRGNSITMVLFNHAQTGREAAS